MASMDKLSDEDLVVILLEVLHKHEGPPLARLRLRLRELGKNKGDEGQQFRLLQKACRESADLARDLEEAGLGQVALMQPHPPSVERGRLVQAFNVVVEQRWEGY